MISSKNLRKTLIAALVAEICLPGFVMAQSNVAEKKSKEVAETSSVTVTGIRAALESTLKTKRGQEGVVDLVSAEEAGKFPDTNVAEALQRLPGVAIQRNNGEGRYISVRGLGPEYNLVLVNGRTMTTDNGGREFSFDLLSPDIISKAMVYKTSNAYLSEGGIGATVDIQTARPLDYKGLKAAVSGSGSYDDRSKKSSANASGMFSFTNEARNFGVLGSVSYTDRVSRTDSITSPWRNATVSVINGKQDSKNLTADAISRQNVYVPQYIDFRLENGSRKRTVANTTLQYAPNKDIKITVDGLYSHLDQKIEKNVYGVWFGGPFLNAKVDGNGSMTSFDTPGKIFFANNPAIAADSRVGNSPVGNDMTVQYDNRVVTTQLLGLNGKWRVNSEWNVEADLSTNKTKLNSYSPNADMGYRVETGQNFDANFGGTIPTLINGTDIADLSLMRANWLSLSRNLGSDTVREGNVKASWNHDIGYFQGLEMGAAFSNRKLERSGYTAYGNNAYNGYNFPIDPSTLQVVSLNDFMGGISNAPKAFASFQIDKYLNWLNQPSTIAAGSNPKYWTPRTDGILPTDINPVPSSLWGVEEKVQSAFIDSKWEGTGWSANFGVRLISVESSSYGRSRLLKSVEVGPDNKYVITYGDLGTNTAASNKYNNVLPALNLKYSLAQDMLLRFGASKTLTRPTLSQLSVNNSYGGVVGNATSGGGNPNLKPMMSTNLDLSYEWYLSDTNYVSVAAFNKNLSNLLQSTSIKLKRPEFPEETTDTRVRNVATAKIQGIELGGQYAFSKSSWASGFGVSGSYTYVKATADSATGGGECGGYFGLSPHITNVTGFYEQGKFQARISYNHRAAFLLNCGSGTNQATWRDKYGQADASLRYNLTDKAQLYADLINLGGARIREYNVLVDRFAKLEDNGRRINIGFRYNFN